MVGWHHWLNEYEPGQTPKRWWGTGRPGALQSIRSQRIGHNLATERQQRKHIDPCLHTTLKGTQVFCVFSFFFFNAVISVNLFSWSIYTVQTLLKSTLQVHSTLQCIYFKNILLYKRFTEHWHVNLGWNSKHVTNSAVARMLSSIVNYTITSHHFSFKYVFLNKKWILQWNVPAGILIS